MTPVPFPAQWLPERVNAGPWLVHYTFDELEERIAAEPPVLPVCSLATPAEEIARLGALVLPPLYHEALSADADLKTALLARIEECFPYYVGTRKREACRTGLRVVELPPRELPSVEPPALLAFSVDTAVEEHGPHLPLATDTIQSYAVLEALAREFPGLQLAPPVDYGHLTWGLPLGLSIDITPPLVTRYVRGFADALVDWLSPAALYVVDVHGSPVHRAAIQEGLAASRAARWKFRWLHEPLVPFAAERGDQHAGGVETAFVEHVNPQLLDARWWPHRKTDLAAGQMSFDLALQLTPDLPQFIAHAETHDWNGIVGRIENYTEVDGAELMARSLAVAREDVRELFGRAPA